ncbi:MAG: hypothetical protein EA384_15680 [Spirochaetaceae bacterium]|nr:MAG: hypothetical protein EA384_15680 [Spirochaetaceae bacterium]
MNKKVNTVLFVLGATLVNVLIMVFLFLILFILFARFLAPSVPPAAGQFVLLGLFLVSVVGTYFVYHRLIALLQKKVDMERYFDPIFGRRRR